MNLDAMIFLKNSKILNIFLQNFVRIFLKIFFNKQSLKQAGVARVILLAP
jgi:hypothetical protein